MPQIYRSIIVLQLSLWVFACSNKLDDKVKQNTAIGPGAHEQYFPIASGTHGGTDCNTCHGSFDSFTEFSCVECHEHFEEEMDPVHAAVPAYVFTGQSCYGCHPRGDRGDWSESHARFFPIDANSTHSQQKCSDCHTMPDRPEFYSCIDCHEHRQEQMDQVHSSLTDYKYESPACLSCHPDGTSAGSIGRVEHAKFYPIEMSSKHGQTACSACHPDSSSRKVVTCVGCHPHQEAESATAHLPVGGYLYSSQLCMKCHYDASVPRVTEHQPFRIDAQAQHKPSEAACLECHPDNLPGRPFESADFKVFNCGKCHSKADMDDEHQDEDGYRYDFPTCVKSGCHPDGESPEDD